MVKTFTGQVSSTGCSWAGCVGPPARVGDERSGPSVSPSVMKRDTSDSVFALIIHVASLGGCENRVVPLLCCTTYPSFSQSKMASRDCDEKKKSAVSKPREHAIFPLFIISPFSLRHS